MPEEVTVDMIRVRVRDPGDFQDGSFSTIDIDGEKGIKAVIGRPKGSDTTEIQTFIFDKEKWTKEDAVKWVEEHKSDEFDFNKESLEKGISFKKTVEICKKDDAKRVVYGVIYEPDVEDTQGDSADAEEIEKAAWDFLKESRTINLQHGKDATDVFVVESYVTPQVISMNGKDVKKGAWMMAVQIENKDLWDDVKTGRFTGFSMEGIADRIGGEE